MEPSLPKNWEPWWDLWARTRPKPSCKTWLTRSMLMAMVPSTSQNSLPWWRGKWRKPTARKKSEKPSEFSTRMATDSSRLLNYVMWWRTSARNSQTRKSTRWLEKPTSTEMGKSTTKSSLKWWRQSDASYLWRYGDDVVVCHVIVRWIIETGTAVTMLIHYCTFSCNYVKKFV